MAIHRPGRTSPAVTSISRSATWPAASFGSAIPAIAALSVQSESGGMNSSTPELGRHRREPLAKPRVGRHAAADPQPLQCRSAERLAGLGDQDVDDRLLEARGHVGDSFGGGVRQSIAGVLAVEGVKDGGLEAGEAEDQPLVVQERPGKGERRRICRLAPRARSPGPPG